jgi:hypothetical protein
VAKSRKENPVHTGHSRQEQEIALRWIAYNEREYRSSRNPVYAWEAYLSARCVRLPPPEWALDYFDRVSRRLFELSRTKVPTARRIATAATEALELAQPGKKGRVNPFRELTDKAHEVSIAFQVYRQLHALEHVDRYGNPIGGHTKQDSAFQAVADTHPKTCAQNPKCKQISRSQVRNCWKKYQHMWSTPHGLSKKSHTN